VENTVVTAAELEIFQLDFDMLGPDKHHKLGETAVFELLTKQLERAPTDDEYKRFMQLFDTDGDAHISLQVHAEASVAAFEFVVYRNTSMPSSEGTGVPRSTTSRQPALASEW